MQQMSRFPWLPLFALAWCALWVSAPVRADVVLGGDSRAAAMGGAGLASGEAQDAYLNPAFLAESGMRFGIEMPHITTRLSGAGLGDAFDLLGSTKIGATEALDLVRELGDGPTRLDATARAGVQLPKMDLSVSAQLRTDIIPNEAFRSWVRAGARSDDVAHLADARADLYAGGMAQLPSFAVGVHLPLPQERGKLAVGVRVKPTQAYYSHYVVDAAAITGGEARPADEMGGKEYLKAHSFSADLGVLYSPPRHPDLRFAAVATNLIEPKAIEFAVPTLDGMFSQQIAPRSYSVGAAFVRAQMTLAADLVDVTESYGDRQVRVGAELRLPLGIALRGGYNSASGFTGGIGLGSFGIAVSKRTPIMLSESLTF